MIASWRPILHSVSLRGQKIACATAPRRPLASVLLPARSRAKPFHRKQKQAHVLRASPADVVLPPVSDNADLESQQKWLAAELQLWLDDEWTKLDVHRDLGEATAQAYVKARVKGIDEIGEILLSISSELLSFDFKETFVNAFDVANKAAEVLMRSTGQETASCG